MFAANYQSIAMSPKTSYDRNSQTLYGFYAAKECYSAQVESQTHSQEIINPESSSNMEGASKSKIGFNVPLENSLDTSSGPVPCSDGAPQSPHKGNYGLDDVKSPQPKKTDLHVRFSEFRPEDDTMEDTAVPSGTPTVRSHLSNILSFSSNDDSPNDGLSHLYIVDSNMLAHARGVRDHSTINKTTFLGRIRDSLRKHLHFHRRSNKLKHQVAWNSVF